MEIRSIQLDTSFCIRLLNRNDELHQNVLSFYQYFIDQRLTLKLSTISMAEYCVKGKLDELPLRNLEIIPFNSNHAVRAGAYGKTAFSAKAAGTLDINARQIIPNDIKLFAQAHIDADVTHFATSDVESIKVYQALAADMDVDFQIINVRESLSSQLGILPFES